MTALVSMSDTASTEGPSQRIDPLMVLRNLERLESPNWRSRALEICADTALVAWSLDSLPEPEPQCGRADLLGSVHSLLGDAYVTGFGEAFSCTPPTRKNTSRYVQGLEDGNRVGRAVRRGSQED